MTDSSSQTSRARIVTGVTVLFAGIAAFLAWRQSMDAPGSDEAFVRADTVAIAPRVAGPIVDLRVRQGSHVNAGDTLFMIDPRPFDLAVANAAALEGAALAQVQIEQRRDLQLRALCAAADAEVIGARAVAVERRATLARVTAMADGGFATAQELDVARAALASSEALLLAAEGAAEAARAAVSELSSVEAQVMALRASLDMARLERRFCEVTAPVSGTVIALDFAVGTHAMPGIPLFQLLVDDTWTVDAPLLEGHLKDLRVGDAAEVWVMTDPSRRFECVVESIGVGVRPTDEINIGGIPFVRRELDWVRVAQRFPVRLRVIDPDPSLFRLGASASVIVHPGTGPGDAR